MEPQSVRTRIPICVLLSPTGSESHLYQDNVGDASTHSIDLTKLKVKSVQEGLGEAVQQ